MIISSLRPVTFSIRRMLARGAASRRVQVAGAVARMIGHASLVSGCKHQVRFFAVGYGLACFRG